MADIQREQQAADMIDIIKPISHADDDAFVFMLREQAKRCAVEGQEELEFVLLRAADRIEMWKSHYEASQEVIEDLHKALDKANEPLWPRP